jgi:hypothetical protein
VNAASRHLDANPTGSTRPSPPSLKGDILSIVGHFSNIFDDEDKMKNKGEVGLKAAIAGMLLVNQSRPSCEVPLAALGEAKTICNRGCERPQPQRKKNRYLPSPSRRSTPPGNFSQILERRWQSRSHCLQTSSTAV